MGKQLLVRVQRLFSRRGVLSIHTHHFPKCYLVITKYSGILNEHGKSMSSIPVILVRSIRPIAVDYSWSASIPDCHTVELMPNTPRSGGAPKT